MTPDADLIDLIYAALLGEAPWQSFLDRLARALPEGKAVFFSQGLGAQPGFSALHAGMTEAALAAYGAHFFARNPWIPAMERARPGSSVDAMNLYPHELLIKSEYYNDFLRPNLVENSAGLVIERSQATQFNLTVMSSDPDPAASAGWAAQFTRLSPHLMRAARVYANDVSLVQASEFGGSLLDSLAIGGLLIGEGPRLKTASQTAQDFNAAGRVFSISPVGRFRFVAAAANDRLGRMLQRPYDGPKVVQLAAGDLRLTLIRITREGLFSLLQGPAVFVIIERDRFHRHPRGPAELQSEYGLTGAELRVLLGLLDSRGLPEIAADLGVAHETVRSQLRRLFEKTDVRSQIQLLNRIHGDGRVKTGE